MYTMCPPGCHHNGFMATPELGHRMYGLYIYIYIYIIYIAGRMKNAASPTKNATCEQDPKKDTRCLDFTW